MTKQEEYQLSFTKVQFSNNIERKKCLSVSNTDQSLFLATILSGYDKIYTEQLITSIEAASTNESYEEFHIPDSLGDDFIITINPPNVDLGDSYSLNMNDWKELIQEWLTFLNS